MQHATLSAIQRYVELSPTLATAGQPTEDQLIQALQLGFDVVINLGLHTDPSYALPDEEATVRAHGAKYVHIPVAFGAPQLSQFHQFCRAMGEAANSKVLIHCRHNKRVPVFVALDRVLRQGWTKDAALQDMRVLWEPDAIWTAFIERALLQTEIKPLDDHHYREFERAGWERAAPAYAGSFEAITNLFARQLLEAVGAGPQSKLLDVACGSGYMSAMAAASGAQVEAVDFSTTMVDAAARRYPALSFRQSDAEALPFADGMFDAVVIGFGVHHFPFPVQALAEANRVLRAGGRLGFTVWASIDEHMLQKVVVDAVREVGNPAATLPVSPAGAVCEIETCLRLLRESGFASPPPHAQTLVARAPIESARQLIDLLTAGTVRMSSIIRSLPQDKMALLTSAVERSIERYREGNVFKVPAAAILAVGVKA
jgi:uncharacterized protein (TIGR01244 family)